MQAIHPTKLKLGILGVPLAALSAWLCGAVAKYGIHLDPAGVNALAVTGGAAVLPLVVKLIHDVEERSPAAGAVIADVERAAPELLAAAEKVDPSLESELEGLWADGRRPSAR